MSLLSVSREAFELHSELVENIRMAKLSFVQTGKLLYELNKKNLFKKAIGEGIDSWEDYLRQPEISLSTSEANRLMQIFQIFVLQYGYSAEEISSVPIKNLHYLLPLAKKKGTKEEVVRELIDDAKVLHQTDFRIKIGETKTPDGDRTYEYLVMRKCKETGEMLKIHGITQDKIKELINHV